MITQKKIKELLTYDKDTGIFRWAKARTGVTVGKIAGYVDDDGYRRIKIDGILYCAHRLAWLLVHGRFPENEIDHVNGDRDDNRLSNLRDVTHRVNQQNYASHRDGKLVGACWREDRKKWDAQIWVNGKVTHLGYYDTEQEAHEAYLKAVVELEVRE